VAHNFNLPALVIGKAERIGAATEDGRLRHPAAAPPSAATT